MARRSTFFVLVISSLVGSLLALPVLTGADRPRGNSDRVPPGLMERSAQRSVHELVYSTRDSVRLVLSTPDVDLPSVTIAGHHYRRLGLYDAVPYGEAGVPCVPVIQKLVAVPDCDSIVVETHRRSARVRRGIDVYPQPETREGPEHRWGQVFARNAAVYEKDAEFPRLQARVESAGYLRGQRLAWVSLYPVTCNRGPRCHPRAQALEGW